MQHPMPLPTEITRFDRTLVMGVVNVTPDSFSDGGLWFHTDAAIAHGRDLISLGADLLDVGGESTRPGSARVTQAEELRRVIPVVKKLAGDGSVVSVDTMRAAVARQAVAAGALIVNDVSGGYADPDMLATVAELGVVYVVMHWRGQSERMNELERYDDVVADVGGELDVAVDRALRAGVRRNQIVLDPGLGFSKATGAHNWPLLARLDALQSRGFPVLVGAARKRFLAPVVEDITDATQPTSRDTATAAVTALAAEHGAWCVRVHDVAPSAAAVRVAQAWRQADLAPHAA